MNRISARKSNSDYLESNTTVVTLNRETAVEMITDLAQDISNTGIGKLVLKCSDGSFLIVRVQG